MLHNKVFGSRRSDRARDVRTAARGLGAFSILMTIQRLGALLLLLGVCAHAVRGGEPSPSAGRALARFPPPESQGGWPLLATDAEIESRARMDPRQIAGLRQWLLASDNRPFAAVVIRHGAIALQVERGNSAATDARRVASVSKAVCATVLAIASEQSQLGKTPRKMTFDDKALRLYPMGPPAQRSAQGGHHHQTTAQPHLRDLPRGNGRAQRRRLGLHPGPLRRPPHRAPGFRSRHALRLLDPGAGPRRPGVRNHDRQALRPVRHRRLVQAAGHRTLVFSALQRGRKIRPPSLARPGHAGAGLGQDRLVHAQRRPLERPPGHSPMVRRTNRRPHPQRDKPRNALEPQPASLLPWLGASRPARPQERPQRRGHSPPTPAPNPAAAASSSPLSPAWTWQSRAKPAAAASGSSKNTCAAPARRSSAKRIRPSHKSHKSHRFHETHRARRRPAGRTQARSAPS